MILLKFFNLLSTHIFQIHKDLQKDILQAILEDTYVDDKAVEANSKERLGDLQDKKSKILQEGDFHIKSWECSEEEGESKYPGMTWNRKDNC